MRKAAFALGVALIATGCIGDHCTTIYVRNDSAGAIVAGVQMVTTRVEIPAHQEREVCCALLGGERSLEIRDSSGKLKDTIPLFGDVLKRYEDNGYTVHVPYPLPK